MAKIKLISPIFLDQQELKFGLFWDIWWKWSAYGNFKKLSKYPFARTFWQKSFGKKLKYLIFLYILHCKNILIVVTSSHLFAIFVVVYLGFADILALEAEQFHVKHQRCSCTGVYIRIRFKKKRLLPPSFFPFSKKNFRTFSFFQWSFPGFNGCHKICNQLINLINVVCTGRSWLLNLCLSKHTVLPFHSNKTTLTKKIYRPTYKKVKISCLR